MPKPKLRVVPGSRRTVFRHGKPIVVETLDTESAQKVKRLRPETFAIVPLLWAAKASIAMRTPKAMVWTWLLYQSWRTKSRTFAVPNRALADYGVGRHVKTRTLQQLEKVGLITVKWQTRQSPIVTLL
jgi:hypothetical protein